MKPLLIAHRGGALEAFENSFSAFHQALRVGASSIEVDLRATRDGQIVIMHDATLDRTASAHGKVRDFKLKEIQKWKLKNAEPIPTLTELLDLAKGKILLHLEIKEPGFEPSLVQILKRHGMTSSAFVISFHPKILNTVHELDPKIKTGFLFSKIKDETSYPRSCKLVLPHARLLTLKTVQNLKRERKKIHAWVVNDPKHASKLISWGVDGIITDCPRALVHLTNKSPYDTV